MPNLHEYLKTAERERMESMREEHAASIQRNQRMEYLSHLTTIYFFGGFVGLAFGSFLFGLLWERVFITLKMGGLSYIYNYNALNLASGILITIIATIFVLVGTGLILLTVNVHGEVVELKTIDDRKSGEL